MSFYTSSFCFLNERETGNRNAVSFAKTMFRKLTHIRQFHIKSGQSCLQRHRKVCLNVVRYVYGNFCYWYHVAQYYLSHLDRGSPIWMLSCFQNKTEEAKVEVRPCII